jgi:hypothetical protein
VGRWQRLISTTNWEKGQIITQWRAKLVADGAPAAAQSDEAWARHVGGVSSQHVGRLRRVYQRYGEVYQNYEGLFWSHFQAALDWDDAEMWLEGAAQSGWSVSRMRRMRWETLGAVAEQEPLDEEIVPSEFDEDFDPDETDDAEQSGGEIDAAAAEDAGESEEPSGRASQSSDGEHESTADDGALVYADDSDHQTIEFVRPFEHLSELPEDLADAFEAFKLAILRHKADGWNQISQEDVLASLDALKELACAP